VLPRRFDDRRAKALRTMEIIDDIEPKLRGASSGVCRCKLWHGE
jgi:hypothetical protein